MALIEESFTKLEEINEKIRDPKLSLEKAAKLFEDGTKLSDEIEKSLNKLEKKIEILVNPVSDENNEPEFELFAAQE